MKIIKNKLEEKKFELTVVLLILVFAGLMKIVTMTASPVSAEDFSSMPSILYNDVYFVYSVPGNSTFLPLEIIDGVYYVPISLFKFLNCVMDSTDNYKDKFYIQHGNNYINFNVSAGKAESLFDGFFYDNISCQVKFLRGTTYVPAAITSIYLGLNWKYYDEYKVIRIWEAGIKRTADEILKPFIKKIQTTPPETTVTALRPFIPYAPSAYQPYQPEITATSPITIMTATTNTNAITDSFTTQPDTKRGDDKPIPTTTAVQTTTAAQLPTTTEAPPTTTEEPTTAEDTKEIENYLIFYDSYEYETTETNNTDNAESESTEPTAQSETDDLDNINNINKLDEILEIIAQNEIKAVFFLSGREIAENPNALRKIYSSGNILGIKIDNADNLIQELEETNALIYSVVKHKTRLCMFTQTVENIEASNDYENKLKENGYYLCENTVGAADLADITDSNDMIEFMKHETVNIFMFDMNDANAGIKNYIDWSVQAAKTKFYIKFSYINNANIENIKNQISEINTLKTTKTAKTTE